MEDGVQGRDRKSDRILPRVRRGKQRRQIYLGSTHVQTSLQSDLHNQNKEIMYYYYYYYYYYYVWDKKERKKLQMYSKTQIGA